jgi:glycine/D-amino acid oxidase-like deaminating enzyme
VQNVAIIGAGQTGASAALALARRGVQITLYSDRPREELRNSAPATGSAVNFGKGQEAEARMGLPGYPDAPSLTGMSSYIALSSGVEAIAFDTDFSRSYSVS